ncbi:MAG: cobyrinate a,c-diamide synthase [Chloroflexota bacterium]
MIGLVIAGTASGIGKTTVSMALISALRAEGAVVQPFKVGPDYIDPTHLSTAAERVCRNLDSWLMPREALLATFARAMRGADFAVVEGVMGLFDGRTGQGNAASTAEVANILGLPILLVVDAGRVGRSVAATVRGFATFDRGIRLAGVIVNNVASATHGDLIRSAIQDEAELPVVGVLRRDERIKIQERHLGLVPGYERPDAAAVEALAGRRTDLDLTAIRALARPATIADPAVSRASTNGHEPTVTIAVARDEAFGFYYQDNLELLTAAGARIETFSPLRDARLPEGAAGLYLGGGFPELYARGLAVNEPMLEAVRSAISAGMPCYAECGGLMYLGRSLTDLGGARHALVGALPVDSRMLGSRPRVGYRDLVAARDSILFAAGQRLRGHEHHWSSLEQRPAEATAAYLVQGEREQPEGFVTDNLLASYVHLHFATEPGLANRFVLACRRWAPRASVVPATTCNSRKRLGALATHGLPPDEIERLSQARIEQMIGHELPTDEPARSLFTRILYAAGDTSLVGSIHATQDFVGAATAALDRGAPIVVDVHAVAAGIRAQAERAGSAVHVAIDAARTDGSADPGLTRSARGIQALAPLLEGAVVAIGNAPTALLALLDLVGEGKARPAAVIGLPVGFVAAAESKALLRDTDLPHLTILGTRGGSPLAAAALNFVLAHGAAQRIAGVRR